jgi:pimeloyl-ACP methyl ester carboxylesterase
VVRTFVPQAAAGEPGLQKHIERTIQVWTQLPEAALRNFFRLEDPTRDVRALLPAIRMPTLVLQGEADRLNPVEMAKWTTEQIAGAQFYALKGRSHMIAGVSLGRRLRALASSGPDCDRDNARPQSRSASCRVRAPRPNPPLYGRLGIPVTERD